MDVLNWILEHGREILEILAALLVVVSAFKAKQFKAALSASVTLLQTVEAAVEEEEASGVKQEVAKAVDIMKKDVPLVAEVQDAVLQTIDPKKHVPPIKRFWRRFIAGKNAAGVAARVIAGAALKRTNLDIEL